MQLEGPVSRPAIERPILLEFTIHTALASSPFVVGAGRAASPGLQSLEMSGKKDRLTHPHLYIAYRMNWQWYVDTMHLCIRCDYRAFTVQRLSCFHLIARFVPLASLVRAT